MGKIVDGIYYGSNNMPAHRGIVEIDGDFYYAEKGGVIVKDRDKIVHREMANGLVPNGTYYFDNDGKLVKDSYVKPNKTKKKSKYRILKLLEEKRVRIIIRFASAAMVLIIFAVLANYPSLLDFSKNSGANTTQSESKKSIVFPTIKGTVYLCSNIMQRYYKGDISLEQAVNLDSNPYSPLVCEYELPEGYKGTITVSENKNYSNGQKFEFDYKNENLTIDNLKTGTKYYYFTEIRDSDGNSQTLDGTFKTAKTNRFINISGLYNTRDIGGYDTLYGKKLKQGLLIRGTEIDGLVESKYFLNDKEDIKPFGFVCDLDLRSSTVININYKSRLGDNVSHKFYDSPMYGGIFSNGSVPILKQIFTDLADKNNYPMYLHCTYGADRTGTIVFLLQGILGVSEEDMKTEYKLTGFFSKDYVLGTNLNGIYGGIEGVAGNTINEKIENYLLKAVGITNEQIESLRDIFLN